MLIGLELECVLHFVCGDGRRRNVNWMVWSLRNENTTKRERVFFRFVCCALFVFVFHSFLLDLSLWLMAINILFSLSCFARDFIDWFPISFPFAFR